MVATQVEKKYLTVDEYMVLGDQRIEVSDGELIYMSPNMQKQSLIVLSLWRKLDRYAEDNDLGIVLSEATFVLDASDRNDWVKGARMPDVAFIAKDGAATHEKEHPENGPWRLAPDIAVEVVSPTDAYSEVSKKVADYLQYGVQLVWVIDPQVKNIKVYSQDNPDGKTLHVDDTLSGAPVLPEWSMPIAEILG